MVSRYGGFYMGLFDEDDEELEALAKEANSFQPLELTEANVHRIYEKCLAFDNNPDRDYTVLVSTRYGYTTNQPPIGFDKKRIKANKETIYYLLGQLRAAHPNTRKAWITLQDAQITYSGKIWTTKKRGNTRTITFSC